METNNVYYIISIKYKGNINPHRLLICVMFISFSTLLMAAVRGGWSLITNSIVDIAALLWILWPMAVAEGREMGSGSEFDLGQWVVLTPSGIWMMVC
jgi:hypothetical protein